MNFEKDPNLEGGEKMEKQETLKLFKNTRDFEERAHQDPGKAEEWMNAAYEEYEQYQNKKWLMDRQRTLLGIYCEQSDKQGAMRMVEETPDPFAQQGRIEKFEKIFGEKYSGESQQTQFENDPDSDMDITDSTTFKKVLLKEGRRGIQKAEEWLEEQERGDKYDPKVLQDRRQELNMAKQYWGEK